jgi:hypothetical protein
MKRCPKEQQFPKKMLLPVSTPSRPSLRFGSQLINLRQKLYEQERADVCIG